MRKVELRYCNECGGDYLYKTFELETPEDYENYEKEYRSLEYCNPGFHVYEREVKE